ncbi:MAG: hypothetical protein AB7F86_01540 [Bdellovibrionales bacterium]
MSKLNLAVAVVAVFVIGACGKKKDDPGGKGNPKVTFFGDETPSVPGPNIQGAWDSECNPNWKSAGTFRKFAIVYTADRVERTTTTFGDKKCTRLIESKKLAGPYRFVEKLNQDIYTVQYAFELDGGAHQLTKENVRLDKNVFYIADFAAGEGMGVLTEEPLYARGSLPDPKPQQEAKIAEQYTQARYAICNAQGNIWVMDLTQVQLTANGAGRMKITSQTCSEAQPRPWVDGTFRVEVTLRAGYPQMKSLDTGFGRDGIETWDSGTGLQTSGFPRSAMGVINGNSGPCYFLENVGKIDQLFKICK